MSGRNAKTNFPLNNNDTTGDTVQAKIDDLSASSASLSSEIHAKLRKYNASRTPSLTCLRLDQSNSLIGVWQNRAVSKSDSSWVMTVKLGPASSSQETTSRASQDDVASSTEIGGAGEEGLDEEERVALQMIEELLNTN